MSGFLTDLKAKALVKRGRRRPFRAIWRFLKNIPYWLRTHTYNRYHILNLSGAARGAADDYRWGWCDRDHLMLLACFKLLCDFIEREAHDGYGVNQTLDTFWPKGYDHIDKWTRASVRHQLRRERQLRELYDWWTVERPKRDWQLRSIDTFEEDQKVLMKLVRLRGQMWT